VRTDLLRNLAVSLREAKHDLAELACDEMGKPLREGVSEVEKCAKVCDYYADNGKEFLAPKILEYDGARCSTVYQPIGTILAVMPWNFPFWQVFRFVAPNLVAGNTVVLKHAGNVSNCAKAIEAVIIRAGFPKDVFRSLIIPSERVAELIGDPRIKAVTLTGSTAAGKAVAGEAGKNIKKSVLELGGSDAYVVLEDADLDLAVDACVTSRLINAGQSCISAKRMVVVDAVHDEFVARFVESMKSKVMGDPHHDDTDIGPMARLDLREELHTQVTTSVANGACLALGGEIPLREGAFYPPTVLTNVAKGMPAYDEELFGPVAAIIRAQDQAQAILIANDSQFGLGAAIFTADVAKGHQIASTQLEAGNCFVNDFVKSDPRLPFGGTKLSGYGRELSKLGFYEFLNAKTVVVA
jgi:succinate-semialdehyde dehydrogenase/glutarate-semialdehyde dehydrogenase